MNATSPTDIPFLPAVLSPLLPRPSQSSLVTLLGNRQVRLLSWNMKTVGKFFCCSRCRGFAVADMALIFPVAIRGSL